jgi:hypothetical protein
MWGEENGDAMWSPLLCGFKRSSKLSTHHVRAGPVLRDPCFGSLI